VTDLRTVAHSGAGELALHLEPVNVPALLGCTRATFQLNAQQKKIDLAVEVGLALAMIQGDEARLA